MSWVFNIWYPKITEVDLGCNIIPDWKAIVELQDKVNIMLDDKLRPAFVKTEIEKWIDPYTEVTVILPKWCQDCLKFVKWACKNIVLDRIFFK